MSPIELKKNERCISKNNRPFKIMSLVLLLESSYRRFQTLQRRMVYFNAITRSKNIRCDGFDRILTIHKSNKKLNGFFAPRKNFRISK